MNVSSQIVQNKDGSVKNNNGQHNHISKSTLNEILKRRDFEEDYRAETCASVVEERKISSTKDT